ncbi:MAG: hypothetical protein Q8Q20_04245 [bacterium]|nr:hypothetical protein [bacterium]
MKIRIDKPPRNEQELLRRCGYFPMDNRRTGQRSYVRELRRTAYPRFHVYVDSYPDALTVNLHLDAKRPTYSGTRAHAGEYDSPIVADEVQRIQSIIANL